VLKGVVRIENLKEPEHYISEVLNRVKPEYLTKQYDIPSWDGPEDFLTKVAERSGRLLKHAEPNIVAVAKTVLYDWQKGRLPFFAMPPFEEETTEKAGAQHAGAKLKVPPKDSKETADLAELTPKQAFTRIRVALEYNEEDAEDIRAETSATAGEGEILDWDDLYQSVKGQLDDDVDETVSVPDGKEEEADEPEGSTAAGDEEQPAPPKRRKLDNVKPKPIIEPTTARTLSRPAIQPFPRASKGKKQRRLKNVVEFHDEMDGSDEDTRHKAKGDKRRRVKQAKVGEHFYKTANVKNRRDRSQRKDRSSKHQENPT